MTTTNMLTVVPWIFLHKSYPLTDPKEYADYAVAFGLEPREIEGALEEIKALPGVTDEYLAEVAFAFEQIFEIDLGAL